MKLIFLLLFSTLLFPQSWGGNTAPRWGGNSAPAWGGNPMDDAPSCEWIVTSTDDAGAGTLRQMIADASAGDTICFDESLAGMEIVIDSALVIDKDLSIFGFGTNRPIISADSGSRVFEVSGATTDLVLRGLRITKGSILAAANLPGGAGIYMASASSLVIDSCIVDSCFAQRQSGIGQNVYGGGIHVNSLTGSVTITNSIIADNTIDLTVGGASSANGGGLGIINVVGNITISQTAIIRNRSLTTGTNVDNGGGAHCSSTGVTSYINCTISGNSADRGGGGGLAVLGAVTVIDFCTISNNSITGGVTGTGGITFGATLDTLRNSIIANNAGATTVHDASGTLTYEAESCIEVLTGLTVTTDGGGNLNTDPGLAALALDGETWTHAIDSGDPVYNVGDCDIGTGGDVDQRGVARPQSTECDMGAFEVE